MQTRTLSRASANAYGDGLTGVLITGLSTGFGAGLAGCGWPEA